MSKEENQAILVTLEKAKEPQILIGRVMVIGGKASRDRVKGLTPMRGGIDGNFS